jgi:hypothetical protein
MARPRDSVRGMHRPGLIGALLLTAGTLACGGAEPIIGCEAAGSIRPVCGFQNPEDLALLPGGYALIVSQFGAMDGTRPGSLAVFDLRSEELALRFAGSAGDLPDVAAGDGWGDADCPGPPTESFSPHGIDLAERPDGRLALAVVNHGGRESVELFEVFEEDGYFTVEWRGCAIPAEGTFMNDVVWLPDGGFLVTHMYTNTGWGTISGTLGGLAGLDTGYVLEWQPERGFSVVPGSDAPMPNGIEVSDDGEIVYLNAYLGNEVRAISRSSGELLGAAEVDHPDNVTWGEGRLLVASHPALFELGACGSLEEGSCPAEFVIVAIDPATMVATPLLRHAGAPMGGATVALERSGALILGSFAGDRIAIAELD